MNGKREAIIRILLLVVLTVLVAISIGSLIFALKEWNKIKNNPDIPSYESDFLNKTVTVLIADTVVKRTLGLSGRKSLSEDSAMLFDFGFSDFHGIWMKDMNFPIDIFWLNENFIVVDLKTGVDPETYPEVFKPSRKASYVLETNADFAKSRQIEIGSQLDFLK